jgi:hypothetical protein
MLDYAANAVVYWPVERLRAAERGRWFTARSKSRAQRRSGSYSDARCLAPSALEHRLSLPDRA